MLEEGRSGAITLTWRNDSHDMREGTAAPSFARAMLEEGRSGTITLTWRNGSHDTDEALQGRKAWARPPHERRLGLDVLPRCESNRLAPSKCFQHYP